MSVIETIVICEGFISYWYNNIHDLPDALTMDISIV
jgi:hypothetical protein